MISPLFEEGVISRAVKNKTVAISVHDIREFSNDKHNKVDDYPFGGGPGMLLRPEPIFKAIELKIFNERASVSERRQSCNIVVLISSHL